MQEKKENWGDKMLIRLTSPKSCNRECLYCNM